MNPALPTRYSERSQPLVTHVKKFAPSERAKVAEIWQELERLYGGGALTCSWSWTDAWLQSYGSQIDHKFIVSYVDGRAVGVAMLTRSNCRRRGPIPINAVHIGTAGEQFDETVRVEYNRILVDPSHRRLFAQQLLRAADRFGLYSNEVLFDGFSSDELSDFIAIEPELELDKHVCYVTELRRIAESGQTVLESLRRHTAAKIRRSMRRLEEVYGPITVEWAQTTDQANEIFAELQAIHAARWNADGQPGVFSNDRFNQFHFELIQRLLPARRILLARVKAGDMTIGCDYGFIERGRVLSYQWGIARLEDSRLSPGLVTGAVIMQAALERGLVEYDWLAGDVLYKKELSTTSRELIWARQPKGVAIHLLDGAARAKRATIEKFQSRIAADSAASASAGGAVCVLMGL